MNRDKQDRGSPQFPELVQAILNTKKLNPQGRKEDTGGATRTAPSLVVTQALKWNIGLSVSVKKFPSFSLPQQAQNSVEQI